MSGYWRDPRASAAAVDADGWRFTGDVGVLTTEGDLQLLGRVHDVFKSGGYNIYPPEIEAALESHPAVRQASVVGAPDAIFGTVAVAFIVSHAAPPTDQELRAHLRERLANYKIPKRLYFLDELPRLPVGKIDKQALREQAARS
jgi:acyl-CoA synthetase (AMP-forming)/AMP-acid ligase II